MVRGKAEDAGGLTPAKDDNAAPHHFDPRTLPIFKCVDYKQKRQTNAGNPTAKQNRVPYEPRQGAGPDFGPSIHEGGPSSWTTSSQWIQIGTIGRKVQNFHPLFLQDLPDSFYMVRAHIVHHNNVSGLKSRKQGFFQILDKVICSLKGRQRNNKREREERWENGSKWIYRKGKTSSRSVLRGG